MHLFDEIKQLFFHFQSREQRYQKIIELGKNLPHFPEDWKIEANEIKGCQSQIFLVSELIEGKVYFYATSDALITAGLAALLIKAYNGQTPETVLTIKPTFLQELDIPASLSPSRSNGLSLIHLRMQKEALKHLSK